MDRAALLNDILEHPDDNALRLAYADWQERNGDPDHAELIREWFARPWHDGHAGVVSDANLDRWAPFARTPGVLRVRFIRGFVEDVTAKATAFIRRGGDWVARHPVCDLTLANVAGRAQRLAACSHLSRITHLTIADSEFGDEDAVGLAQSPFLGKLVCLHVNGDQDSEEEPAPLITDAGLAALLGAPRLGSLEELRIEAAGSIGVSGLARLPAREHAALKRLSLTGSRVDDGGAVELADCAALRGLDALNLCGGEVTTAGLVALLASRRLRRISSLTVTDNRVTGDAVRALADIDLPPALTSLVLNGNPLGAVDADAVGEIFARHPDLFLDVVNCDLPAKSQTKLRRRFPRRLRLAHTHE